MKNFKFSLFIILNLLTLTACKTTYSAERVDAPKVVDNTFQATIVNDSHFTVSIDGKIIKTGEAIKNSFPLRKSQLYDGWHVNYTIPFSKDIFYLHTEKVAITNDQTTVIIEVPSKDNVREAYIVIKNTSKQSVRLTDGSLTAFPFCLEGRVNTQYVEKEYNIAPSKVAVYEMSREDEIKRGRVFVSQGNKHFPVLEHTVLRRGYVYTFEFNGKEVVKVDELPILKMGEPLWKIEDDSLAIEKVLKACNLYYAVGKKRVVDIDGNSYYCPYIRCMDSFGNLTWETEKFSIDGKFSDATPLEGGNLLVCGQSVVANENVGSLLLYSSNGTLQSSKNYSNLQICSNVVASDDGIILVGFDNEGNLNLSRVTVSDNAILSDKKIGSALPTDIIESTNSLSLLYDSTSKTLFLFCNFASEEGKTLPSKLFAIKENGKTEEINLNNKIASVSCAVMSSSGEIYAGGESAIDEKTEEVILKIERDSEVKVFYQGSSPFSYIASMALDEMSKTLVASGVCKAKESYGIGGMPFIASFDLANGKELWRCEYKDMKKNILRSFVPCVDYGFIGSFSSVTQEGEFVSYGASILSRMNATGKIK